MRHPAFPRLCAAGVFMLAAFLPFGAGATPSILVDVGSGKVLQHQEAFSRWYPASLTKLMTAYVTFRALQAGEIKLDSPVTVSKNAASQPPSKMGYKPGSVMTLDNALKMMLIKSANDIAVAVAENVGGTEPAFVKRMNAEAQRLGMVGTHFANPNGLHSPENYSTARDLAILTVAIRREFPQFASYFSIEALTTGKRLLRSYNMLVGRFSGADGMKTGFICASGFNLIGSATRNGRTLAAVVLGADSPEERTEKAAEMLAKGFSTPGLTAVPLESLQPYGDHQDFATDMRGEICTAQAAAERREERDENGRMVLNSPYIQPMNRDPVAVAVGLGGATGQAPAPDAFKVIPIPTPRPDYVPSVASKGQQSSQADVSEGDSLEANFAGVPLPTPRAAALQ